MDDQFKRARETAAQFGEDLEQDANQLGKTLDGLRHGPRTPTEAPDDPPRRDDDGDVNITINR
jgi:hypothetical protein